MFYPTLLHAGQDEPSFIEEPEQTTVERNTTMILSWLIENELCDDPGSSWFMSIVTQNDSLTLYSRVKGETPFPDDYNVTVGRNVCSDNGRKRINVTLTIVLSDSVLQYVDFIRCMMTNRVERRNITSKKFYFIPDVTVEPTTTSTTSTPCTQTTSSTSSESTAPIPDSSSEPNTTPTTYSCSAASARPLSYLLLLSVIQCILILSLTTLFA